MRRVSFGILFISLPFGVYSDMNVALLSEKISLSKEELDALAPRLQDELMERGGCYPMRVVWGRRPAN
jgi:hypothetical protein